MEDHRTPAHDRAARVLATVVAAAGIVGSAIGLYSVYVESDHPQAVGLAATVSTDGLALVAFFCAWRSRRRGYPMFVGALATALSMTAQWIFYAGGAGDLPAEVKGAMSAWVPLSAILGAHLLLHAFGAPDAPASASDTASGVHPGDTRTGAPQPHSPLHPASPLLGAPVAVGRPPDAHPDALEQVAAEYVADALAFELDREQPPALPARMPPRMHLHSVPAVPPPDAPHKRTPSAPRTRTRTAPAGTRRRASRPTDAELADALRSAPDVRSVRAVQAHLKVGQERARRVLALVTED